MAESSSKSKLKRKKSSIEELHADISAKGTPKRSQTPLFSGNSTAKTDGSAALAAAWWNRQQLLPVENLWASTLKCVLPYLEKQHWDPVPDLPHPSAPRPTGLTLDELWCDHGTEVVPLPEPSPLCPSPDPLRLSSSQQDLSVQTTPVLDPPDRWPSSHSSPKRKTMSLRPPVHNWEEADLSARPSSTRGEEESGPESRQLLTELVEVSSSTAPLQKEGTNKEEEEVQRSTTGGGSTGGGGLKNCPMCLLVFPAGFTQLDCDGHLAHCLSEMNVDMTW